MTKKALIKRIKDFPERKCGAVGLALKDAANKG